MTALVIKPAGIEANACIVVPVQEMEAGLIADEAAIAKTIPLFKLSPVAPPEKIAKPKEYLEKKSRVTRTRSLYSHVTHNSRVAEHLDLKKVADKCPSFRPLLQFLKVAAL